MPFNTLSVATAVTPSVVETYFSHYFNRTPLRNKPTAHISYHEGLKLIRQFLEYSSRHSVEELQSFTAQWVPTPTWIRSYDSEIHPQFLESAADLLRAQLGKAGIEKVGGPTWWKWRQPGKELKGEWIETKKDYLERKKVGTKCDRCILYIHGGAYYFGSVDEHRYQIQRHARKLKARVLAPRYRLAPQYPFPCGLQDCLAAYLYLLQFFQPNEILLAGDSAGGGMVLSVLVTLRDQGFPLPAGTILLSPWVDLTHSFPSAAGEGSGDYIPAHGFHHKPSLAWPPPPKDDAKEPAKASATVPSKVAKVPTPEIVTSPPRAGSPQDSGEHLHIHLDGKNVDIKEQIQLYTTNDLITHPLVSPVLQPSLGGLPPMLIQVGGAELLRDEQIYLAHKAANPRAFPPSEAIMAEHDPKRERLSRYPPTDVQLQVWEDLCHVPHTLSFTRPAKYMYRAVAQFGAWALAHAQQRNIEIPNDDAASIVSDGPEDSESEQALSADPDKREPGFETTDVSVSTGAVGKAGEPLPPFRDHMIREQVTRHGVIYPLASQSEIAALALDPSSIGRIKPGPVRKWLTKNQEWEARFSNEKRKVQRKRAKEAAKGYDGISGERPPPSALVGRRNRGVAPEEKKKGKSWGLAMWAGWGSSHDENTLDREQKLANEAENQPSLKPAETIPRSTPVSEQVVHPLRLNAPPSGPGGHVAASKSPGLDVERGRTLTRKVSGIRLTSRRSPSLDTTISSTTASLARLPSPMSNTSARLGVDALTVASARPRTANAMDCKAEKNTMLLKRASSCHNMGPVELPACSDSSDTTSVADRETDGSMAHSDEPLPDTPATEAGQGLSSSPPFITLDSRKSAFGSLGADGKLNPFMTSVASTPSKEEQPALPERPALKRTPSREPVSGTSLSVRRKETPANRAVAATEERYELSATPVKQPPARAFPTRQSSLRAPERALSTKRSATRLQFWKNLEHNPVNPSSDYSPSVSASPQVFEADSRMLSHAKKPSIVECRKPIVSRKASRREMHELDGNPTERGSPSRQHSSLRKPTVEAESIPARERKASTSGSRITGLRKLSTADLRKHLYSHKNSVSSLSAPQHNKPLPADPPAAAQESSPPSISSYTHKPSPSTASFVSIARKPVPLPQITVPSGPRLPPKDTDPTDLCPKNPDDASPRKLPPSPVKLSRVTDPVDVDATENEGQGNAKEDCLSPTKDGQYSLDPPLSPWVRLSVHAPTLGELSFGGDLGLGLGDITGFSTSD